jgi:Zn-dependent protease
MNNLFSWPPTLAALLLIPALFVGFTVHELAHALVAFVLGDTSQVERQRLSFNPLRHVSWLGMAAFLLVGLGWAKPVWVDQTRLRAKNPDVAMLLISIAGPAANLLTALLVLFAMTMTVTLVWVLTGVSPLTVLQFMIPEEPALDVQGLVAAFTYFMVMVNLLLAFFNLLPLPRLDGFQALMSLYYLLRGGRRPTKERETASPLAAPQSAVDRDLPEAPSQTPAEIHFDIALDYHKEGQIDEAIARYRQATGHDEGFALAYYNQGLAYWTKGRLSLAASAFRAAIQTTRDPNLQIQAGLRLRELAHAEQEDDAQAGPVPPLLEPGKAPTAAQGTAPPLDPATARRLWLQLAIGGTLLLVSALMVWLWVTATTLAAVV